nr:zinc finger, CCHC-type [Tanacetum cinerariifolium]
MVEVDKNSKNSKGNKRKFHDKNDDSNKKPKMACWKCGKPGHFKKDSRVKKNNESRDAIFDENRISSIPRPNGIVSSSSETQGGDLLDETPIKIP